MTITLVRGQILASLFPEAPASAEALTSFLRLRFSVGAYKPEITIEGDLTHINIDEAEVARTNDDYRRIVRLAEKGKYDEAKKLIVDAIHKGTAISDIFRIYGQILFDQGEVDESLDQFIEALRWNPENVAALIMVGNLYAKQERNIETARTFFEKALMAGLDNVSAASNNGSVLTAVGQTGCAGCCDERTIVQHRRCRQLFRSICKFRDPVVGRCPSV